MLTHGMILAAGYGRRMENKTQDTPKPLLRVGNDCLIDIAIRLMLRAGISEIIVNLFYQAEKLAEFLQLNYKKNSQIRITCLRETKLLGTGGGVVNALPSLGKHPFIVMSAD